MSTKFGKYLLVLPILSLLVACAQLETQNTDNKIAHNAKTYSDHDKLANHYDTLAKEMVAKAEEKKESLEEDKILNHTLRLISGITKKLLEKL